MINSLNIINSLNESFKDQIKKPINEISKNIKTITFKIGANTVEVELDADDNCINKIWWTDKYGSTDFSYDEKEDKFTAFNNPNGNFLTKNQEAQLKNKIHKLIKKENINESPDNSKKSKDDKFNYMMLNRLKSDCDYFLKAGNRNEKDLWAGNVDDQIAKMKELWNNLEEKPEWLSMEDINNYENKMKSEPDKTDENKKVDTAQENSTDLNEDETIRIPKTNEDKDYIINDVTIVDLINDGDVQSPDINAMLSMVNENLSTKYGNDWGHINILSSNIKESSSFALVDISTSEIIKEFEEKGISDVAIGKNLIVENCNNMIRFKVNSLNGTTRFSKMTKNPVSTITEWIETEFLHEAKKDYDKNIEFLKAKNEDDTIDNYILTRPDLAQEIENIKMFIELGKQTKTSDNMKPIIQDRMYGFATEFPANIEVKNNDDKYTLSFNNVDQVVQRIFGKEWVREVSDDNKVLGLNENTLNESYQQFNIGDIDVVFNPDTYECLYSIPSAGIKDKKINLTKIPSVDTPYDTNTIIKNYIETKFGRISDDNKSDNDLPDNDLQNEPNSLPSDKSMNEPELQEDELPDNPVDDNTNEAQAETGEASFVKIRPKQQSNLESVRERMLDGDTPKSSYIVVNTQDISSEDWDNLTNDLTKPQPWLENIKSIDRKNYSFNVVKVTSPAADFALLIDPLGYNYPRYIAIQE